MSTFKTRYLGSVVVLFALLGGSIAQAQPARKVDLHDIDPATPAGALRAYERISRAANQMCGVGTYQGGGIMARLAARQAQACADVAIADGVQQVNAAAHVDIEVLAGVRRLSVTGVANVSTAAR